MSINLSPIVYDKDFIGLAACVVFSVTFDDSTMATNGWGPEKSLRFNCGVCSEHFAYSPVCFDRDLITLESNHMWIIYITRESFFDFLSYMSTTFRDLDHITMEISLVDGKGLHLETKKCGYRCVFKHDLQHFNSTMMHHRNSFARKHKVLATED